MQIHEITEGALRNIARGFVQGVGDVNFPNTTAVDPKTVQAAQNAQALSQTQPTERIVVAISQPGQTVPAQYYKTNNVWTNELGVTITNPKQTAYLEKLIPTHGKKETIATPPTPRKVSRRRKAR